MAITSKSYLFLYTHSAGGKYIYEYQYEANSIYPPTYSKGSLIETIQAEDGTLSDNGYDESTGFWYVKQNPIMSIILLALGNGKFTRIPLLKKINDTQFQRKYILQAIGNGKFRKL